MRAEHRKLVPAHVLNRLTACGISLAHMTVPTVSYDDYPKTVDFNTTHHRFTMFADYDYPGNLQSIGTFDPQTHLFKTPQRVTYPFLGEADDEFFYNGVAPLTYRQDDFLELLEIAATMTAAAGYAPKMVGVLLAYIAQVQRYAYSMDNVDHFTVPEYLTLITANVSTTHVAQARVKRVPVDMLLNPSLPVHLLLDLY